MDDDRDRGEAGGVVLAVLTLQGRSNPDALTAQLGRHRRGRGGQPQPRRRVLLPSRGPSQPSRDWGTRHMPLRTPIPSATVKSTVPHEAYAERSLCGDGGELSSSTCANAARSVAKL